MLSRSVAARAETPPRPPPRPLGSTVVFPQISSGRRKQTASVPGSGLTQTVEVRTKGVQSALFVNVDKGSVTDRTFREKLKETLRTSDQTTVAVSVHISKGDLKPYGQLFEDIAGHATNIKELYITSFVTNPVAMLEEIKSFLRRIFAGHPNLRITLARSSPFTRIKGNVVIHTTFQVGDEGVAGPSRPQAGDASRGLRVVVVR